MTETLDKQLAKYPDVKEFVDANGNEWKIGVGGFHNREISHIVLTDLFGSVSIPGLKPKHKKYIVTVKTTGNLIGQKPVYEHVYSYETDTFPDWFKSSTPEKQDNSKRVKKTITRWVNVYPCRESLHKTKDKADDDATFSRIACVEVTGEYEVDDV
jgi:hypothetical protein